MEPGETETYIKLLEKMREEYKDRIDVKVGFEVDYPLFDTFEKKYYSDSRIDFLIGSCHFIGEWPFDHLSYIDEFEIRDTNEVYAEYYSILSAIVKSKHFNIIGHFDIVKKFGYRATRDFTQTIEDLASSMAKNDIAAEINTSGLLKPVEEIYPSDQIIGIFFNCNTPITLGSDSHSPDSVAEFTVKAIEKVKKIGYRKVSGFTNRKRHDVIL